MLLGLPSSTFPEIPRRFFQVGYFSLNNFQSPEANLPHVTPFKHSAPDPSGLDSLRPFFFFFFFFILSCTNVFILRGVYIWNIRFFFLVSHLLALHRYNKFFLFFSLFFFSLSLPHSFLLYGPPEVCVSCMPSDGFQATEVTKGTTARKTNLRLREPRGISMRTFFISI